MRILLVEDDPLLGDGLMVGLRQAGFTVDWVRDGLTADLALKNETFDLMVLDLGLPRLTGMALLDRCRLRGQALPVLILTARDDTASKVAGLDAGADDYLVKPVDLDELCARVRALARRATGRSVPVLRHDTLTLDPASRCVTQAGQPVDLSAREFDVLQTLLENTGRVMSRAQIEASLYGWNEEPDSNVLEVHVHHLRRKLGNTLIRTMRGVGYVIERKTA